MPQLAHFEHPVQDTLGNAISGASVQLYREGATVNGVHSGTAPLTVTVRHRGRIAAGDTVFIGTDTATTYSVNSVTATTVVISGFSGTLMLNGGERIVPSNSLPTLYADDYSGATTGNPLTTTASGRARGYVEVGVYEVIASGANLDTTLYEAVHVLAESPSVNYSSELDSATAVAHIEDTRFSLATAGAKLKSGRNAGTEKYAFDRRGFLSSGNVPDVFNVKGPHYGATGDGTTNDYTAINNAITDAAAANGNLGATVYFPAGTYLIGTGLTIPAGVRLLGDSGRASIIKMASGANIDLISRSGSHGQYRWFENLYLDGNRANNASGRGIYWLGGAASTAFRNITIVDMPGRGLVLDNCDLTRLDNIYINNCGDTGFVMLDCTECFISHVASERSGAGASAPAIWIRGGNSNVGVNWVVEQNAGGDYTPSASSIGLELDSTIAFSLYGFGALGNGLGSTSAININNDTTPARTARIQLHNITQASYTNLVLDTASTPNQTITVGGLNHYNDGFQTFSLTLLAPTSGIGWGISSTVVDRTGTGSPEGVVTASVGSIFRRTDGGAATTLYIKESGSGNTGWVAK